MTSTHVKTAHAWGVAQALQHAGYASYDDLVKEAESLGLVAPEKTAATHAPLNWTKKIIEQAPAAAKNTSLIDNPVVRGVGRHFLYGAAPGALYGAMTADPGESASDSALSGALKGGITGVGVGHLGARSNRRDMLQEKLLSRFNTPKVVDGKKTWNVLEATMPDGQVFRYSPNKHLFEQPEVIRDIIHDNIDHLIGSGKFPVYR